MVMGTMPGLKYMSMRTTDITDSVSVRLVTA